MRILIFLIFLYLLSGCSTIKGYLGMGEDKAPQATAGGSEAEAIVEMTPKYSESPQMNIPENRLYKKMTKSRLEEESEVHSQAGSMWISEGQGSYFFVQNKSRREGDVITVNLEGAAFKQVETKVAVIKKLLKQLEEQELKQAEQKLAEENGGDKKTENRAPASAATPTPAPTAKSQPAADKAKDDAVDLSGVQKVQTKLIERTSDGNYRLKGAQPFMIGEREYKVIVTGLIRPEDFNDAGVGSSKLIDPQFDVVSIRRKISYE